MRREPGIAALVAAPVYTVAWAHRHVGGRVFDAAVMSSMLFAALELALFPWWRREAR